MMVNSRLRGLMEGRLKVDKTIKPSEGSGFEFRRGRILLPIYIHWQAAFALEPHLSLVLAFHALHEI